MLANRQIVGISLNRRRNRRWLVIAMYFVIAVLFAVVVRSHRSALFFVLCFSITIVNSFLFGQFLFWGKKYGGLLKPFYNDRELPNDERELAARDRAHYQAYGWVLIPFPLILWIGVWLPELTRNNMSPPQLLYLTQSLTCGAWVLAMTLPQAILLWTEPDIEPDGEERGKSGGSKTDRGSKLALRIPRHLQ